MQMIQIFFKKNFILKEGRGSRLSSCCAPLHCAPYLGSALVSCLPPGGRRIPVVIGSSQKPGTVASFAVALSCLSGFPPPPVEMAPFQSSGARGAVCVTVCPSFSPPSGLWMELCSHIMEVPQLVLQAFCLQPGLSS